MRKGLFALVLAFVSMTAFAQRGGGNGNATPEERAKRQTTMLTESLKLTEDQQKKVYDLNIARAKEMEALRDSQNQDRSKMRESMEKFNAELGKILTPEQQESYKKVLEERRSNRGGGPR